MIEKYRLPNDNVFIWLGTTNEIVNNILILAGGDVLFLAPFKTLSLSRDEIANDMKTLDRKSFNEKYETPIDPELWQDLRKGVETGEYPPYLKTNAIKGYQSMLRDYIAELSRIKDPKKKIEILNEIIGDCERSKNRIEMQTRSARLLSERN